MSNGSDAVERAVHKVLKVPNTYRAFDQTLDQVNTVHRIDGDLLTRLLDLGLPHQASGPELRFDALDLENVGVDLGLPCPRRLAMRWWTRSMKKAAAQSTTQHTVALSGICPDPEHPGDCLFALDEALAPLVDRVIRTDDRSAKFLIQVRHSAYFECFGEEFAPIVQRACQLNFHLLPAGLSTDAAFARDTGLANCDLATQLLTAEALRLELPVRPAAGLLLTVPFPMWHIWLEFQVGTRWLAADPFILHTFARWGIIAASEWPPERSLTGIQFKMWQGRSLSTPIITHAGVRVVPTTELLHFTENPPLSQPE